MRPQAAARPPRRGRERSVRSQACRPDHLALERAHPALPGLAELRAGREPVLVRMRPHPRRRLPVERIGREQASVGGIRLEQPQQERSNQAPTCARAAGTTSASRAAGGTAPTAAGSRRRSPGLPLNPYSRHGGGVRLLVERALDDDLDAPLRDRAEGAVGVDEHPAVEARVHELAPREQVADRRPAQHEYQSGCGEHHDAHQPASPRHPCRGRPGSPGSASARRSR